MANTIALASNYTSLLDEVYKKASVTNDITSPSELIREGEDAKTIYYPQIEMNGLADYDRNNGYVNNSVNVAWKSAEFNYDRGTKISVDVMDDEESRNIAFGRAGGELMRTKVAPEADAFTFAQIAGTAGISAGTPTDLTGATILDALYQATVKMDEDEVPAEGRILFITPTLHKTVAMLDTTKSREILAYFSRIVDVPQARFYSAIDLLDGKTAGEEIGGYRKASAGKKLNFMVVEPSALIKWDKHIASNIILADNNPDADADIMKYRKYGIVDVYKNKVAGIYTSTATT